MKLVVAIIRPEKLETVRTTLARRAVNLFSVSQVLGDSREASPKGMYRGAALRVNQPKLRVELTVKDSVADSVVETLVRLGYSATAVEQGEIQVIVIPINACVLSTPIDEDAADSQQPKPISFIPELLRR